MVTKYILCIYILYAIGTLFFVYAAFVISCFFIIFHKADFRASIS